MKGHIRKKGARYYVSIEHDREQDPDTGKVLRRRSSAGGYRTKREAEEALREALDAARTGWRGPSRLTVAQYLTREWLPAVEIASAPTTAALYRTVVDAYVIPHIGAKRLESLTSADLTTLYADLLDHGSRTGGKLSPATVRHAHTVMRRALGDAQRARHLTWNPATGARPPRLTRSRKPKAWTAEQVRTFLEHVDADRLGALWRLAATTGMRRGELLGLGWEALDLEAGTLRVERTYVSYGRKVSAFKEPKSEASVRDVPLEPRTVAALQRHHRAQATERLAAGETYADRGLVFADEIGDPLSPDRVTKMFAKLTRGAGLPHVSLHGLRHSFATVGLEAGVDVLYLAETLGHSSPNITASIYQHTRP